MTLHDVGRLFRYWERNPPLVAVVTAIAVALGMKPPQTTAAPADQSKRYMTADEARRMIAITGGRM